MPNLLDSWGVLPLPERLRQAAIALLGAEDVPGSKIGLSSLGLLDPKLGIPLWRGRFVVDRAAILSNLFNRTQTPIEEGWSTRRTQVRDFRGRGQTYNSHNGTDFCIPRGSIVVAPADGQIGRVWSEFNRGGLKIATDHGAGVMTVCVHLARCFVQEGELVAAGQPIAISGYSGLDGFATFPWGIPHVHFNVWLNGEPVDPFAALDDPDEGSLWLTGTPTPAPAEALLDNAKPAADFEPSPYNSAAVDALINSCVTASARDELQAIEPLYRRAAYAVSARNYYPTRFPQPIAVYAEQHPRQPRLHMPFSAREVDRVVFQDEI